MNISRSKTANIINRLINLGYIEKENRTIGRGGKGSNLYTVCQEYYEDEKQYPSTYWRVLKKRLNDEGNETVTSCNGLKMTSAEKQKTA